MKYWLRRLWGRQGIRYLFFGGLTVLVNLTSFTLLTAWSRLGLDVSNALSIAAALLFAYGTNTWFVFRSERGTARERLDEFLRFISARLFTMAVEFFGVHFLATAFPGKSFLWKLLAQGLVIILNYILSKRLVYRQGQNGGEKTDAGG